MYTQTQQPLFYTYVCKDAGKDEYPNNSERQWLEEYTSRLTHELCTYVLLLLLCVHLPTRRIVQAIVETSDYYILLLQKRSSFVWVLILLL